MASATLLCLGSVAVVAVALLRAFLPLPEALQGPLDVLNPLAQRLLDRLLAAEWVLVWRTVLVANLAICLVRGLVALDAAWCARVARRAAVAVGHITPQESEAHSRSFAAIAGTIFGVGVGLLAALLVVGPHAAALAVGVAAQPLAAQVLVARAAPPPPDAGPPAAESEPSPPLWDGASRLNVLLMGTDRRPQEAAERPWGNSDTLLLVSLEAGGRSAVMISIPRDVYLTVPGVGPEKINAAYREGGPPLAVQVVGELLDVPVHRWAAIDISAFARMIDVIGGVVVDVERPIRDDEYPAENYAIRRIRLPAGLQWLDGERALWYARSRHGSDDFDRASRQQRLLVSLKDRARDPRTIERLPLLVSTLAEAIQTDVTPREALALARLATSPDVRSEIHSLVLAPPAYGRIINRPELYAIQPDVPRIRTAVADILAGRAVAGASAEPILADEAPISAPAEAVAGQGGVPDNQFLDVEVPAP